MYRKTREARRYSNISRIFLREIDSYIFQVDLPWSDHPKGHVLLRKMIDHFVSLKNVQMAGMLCAVFSQNTTLSIVQKIQERPVPEQNVQPAPVENETKPSAPENLRKRSAVGSIGPMAATRRNR